MTVTSLDTTIVPQYLAPEISAVQTVSQPLVAETLTQAPVIVSSSTVQPIATSAQVVSNEASTKATMIWDHITSSLPEFSFEKMQAAGKIIADGAYKPIEYITPKFNALLHKIQELWSMLMKQMPIVGISKATRNISQFCTQMKDAASVHFQNGISKSQEAWQHLTPYVNTLGEFFKSDIGISTSLLLGGIACLKISQNVESRVTSMALIMIGIGATMASGVYMMRTGILPQLPTASSSFKLPFINVA